VNPANPVADAEIFGPVATLTSFRTPDEAVELANATRYGLAASVWTENVNLAMDLAAKVKAGVVWVNSANIFDAGAAFGGMRESGFGREGGRAGLRDYLRGPEVAEVPEAQATFDTAPVPAATGQTGAIDRTAKMYVGGRQARPDSGQSYAVMHEGRVLGLAGLGSRKDIRNAVEASAKAGAWGRATAHNRAQVLYYLAENLSARAAEFAARLVEGGHSTDAAALEVELSIRRAFYYAAQADKFDGAVTTTKSAHVTLQMPEPFGIMGIVCPDAAPLLGLVSLVLPAIAMGNRVVAVPAASRPLPATDLSRVLDCSDMPGGVLNIVTGPKDELAGVLAKHDEVAALWYVGGPEGRAAVEAESTGNLKAVWALANRDWTGPQGQGRAFLQRATQVKTIWVPYGE